MNFSLWLSEGWVATERFCNSGFGVAVIGSLIGAFAGAYGAQLIAEKTRIREQLLKEIRHTNRAIALTHALGNTMLSLKSQHIKRLYEEFNDQCRRHEEFQTRRHLGQAEKNEFELVFDLKIILVPFISIEAVQKEVFEVLSVGGRTISRVDQLAASVQSLMQAIEFRNEYIARVRTTDDSLEKKAYAYLGVMDSDGVTNQEYSGVIEGLYIYCNDSIYHAKSLCLALQEYGKKLRSKLGWRAVKLAPVITVLDFSKAEEMGLMPDEKQYAQWESGFLEVKGPLTLKERLSDIASGGLKKTKKMWACLVSKIFAEPESKVGFHSARRKNRPTRS